MSAAASAALRRIGAIVSPAGRRARLSILIYHRVLEERDWLVPGTIDAPTFQWQMSALAQHFRVLPLGEALRRREEGSLPSRAAAVSFDDGYEDNARIALPILSRLGIPACFFVATGFLDGGIMWNDVVIESLRHTRRKEIDLDAIGVGHVSIDSPSERRAVLRDIIKALKYLPTEERESAVEMVRRATGAADGGAPLMMSSADVQRLHQAGMEIGGHTVTHPILAQLDPERSRAEIGDGRLRLQEIVDAPVELFAYPNGKPGTDYTAEHVRLVRDLGFRAAVSTRWGAVSADEDGYQLPRFTPWDRTPARFVLRLLRNCVRRSEPGLAA